MNRKRLVSIVAVLAVLLIAGGGFAFYAGNAASSPSPAKSASSGTTPSSKGSSSPAAQTPTVGLPTKKDGTAREVNTEHPFVSHNALTDLGEQATPGFRDAVSNLPIPSADGLPEGAIDGLIQNQPDDVSQNNYTVSLNSSWTEVNKTIASLKKLGWKLVVQNKNAAVLTYNDFHTEFGTGDGQQFVLNLSQNKSAE